MRGSGPRGTNANAPPARISSTTAAITPISRPRRPAFARAGGCAPATRVAPIAVAPGIGMGGGVAVRAAGAVDALAGMTYGGAPVGIVGGGGVALAGAVGGSGVAPTGGLTGVW